MRPHQSVTRHHLLQTALGLGCMLAASVPAARAASDTWDNGAGDNNWQSVTNWASDSQFPGLNTNVFTSTDDATFSSTGSGTINLGPQINLRTINFGVAGGNAGAFTIGDANDTLNLTTVGGVTVNTGVTTAQNIGLAGAILNLSTDANATNTITNNGTAALTVAANVTAVPATGNSVLIVNGTGNTAITGTFTETGAGNSALLKHGAGQLTLSNGSTFNGSGAIGRIPATAAGFPLVVREGVLLLNGGTHLADGEAVIGGVVADGGPGQNARIQVDSGTFNVGSWMSVGRGNGIGVASSELIANNNSIINSANLSGGFNGGGAANMSKGAVTLNGTSVYTVTGNNANFNWGESAGSYMTLTLNNSAKLVHNGGASGTRIGQVGTGILNIASPTATVDVRNLIIGQGANGVGATYNQGTLLSVGLDGLFLGDGAGSASYFRNDNASAAVPNANCANIVAGIGNNSNAVVDVIGGVLSGTRVGGGFFNNTNTTNSQFNVLGGELSAGATGFLLGDDANRINKWLNLNVTGGVFTSASVINLSNANNAANTGILTAKNGVTITADTITAGANANAYVNFDNAILKAGVGTTPALIGAGIDRVTIYAGGLTVNTNGFNKAINAPLLAPDANGGTTFGVAAINLSGTGTGYEARPIVKITGGGGTGATAIADFNLATGQVTGVTVTSPGSGYTSAPTVTILGGGGTALTATAVTGTASGGGLTKTGAGTLTLTGANSFPGPIAVNDGKLGLGGTYANTVSVGATGGLVVADPAAAIGTLTVPSIAFTAGASLTYETAGGTSSDKIVVGSVTRGALGFTLYDTGTTNASTPGTYTLFQYSGSWAGGIGGLSVLNPRAGYSYTFNDTGSAITVQVVSLDADGDGMTDAYESANGLNPNDATGVNGASGNLDGDFATNYEEFLAGTAANNAASDPLNTDNDGLLDSWEVTQFGSIAAQAGTDDFDGDFDSNLMEFTAATDPKLCSSLSDTDADGLGDGWEILYFTNITAKNGTLDSDGDHYTDLKEYKAGTNPNDSSLSPAKGKGTHRWSFTGNLNDSIGSSNATIVNGTNSNANVVTQNADSVTMAGGVKADSQWVRLGSNLLPARNTPVTIQVWGTMNTVQNFSRIFDFHSATTENVYMSWSVGTTGGTDRVQWLDAGANMLVDNTNNYALGTKYHIVMTIEPVGSTGSSLVKWYSAPAYDGVTNLFLGAPKRSMTVTNSMALMNDTINALGFSPYNDGTASATYDEVRLWDGAMTEWALQGLHEKGPDDVSQPDSDSDGLPDAFEMFYFSSLTPDADDDTDTDFSSNLEEMIAGSNPNDASSSPNDSDADGLPDAWEMGNFGDLDETPLTDPDGDFSFNGDELTAGTNPSLYTSFPDADHDNMSDGWEAYYLPDPALDNGTGDDDGDGFNSLAEFQAKSLPNDPLSPGAADGDVDNDGLPDLWEIGWFGDLLQNASGDPDGDGANNLAEYKATSDPSALTGATSTPTDINGDGTPDQYVFQDFTATGSGIQDKDSQATTLTTRLPNTGTTIPVPDPSLDLDTTGAGTLALTSSTSDINNQVNMPQLEALGIPMSSLGFVATDNFRIRAHFVDLPATAGYDQIGAYVGTSSTAMTRVALIGANRVALGVNTNGAADSNAFFGANGTAPPAGKAMTVLIERTGGVWSFKVDNNTATPGVQPDFLNGTSALQAGVFVLDGGGAEIIHRTAKLDSFTVVRFTGAASPDGDNDGMTDTWEQTYFGNTGRDGTGDFDNDGITDLTEFAFGGIPNDGKSRGTSAVALADTNANGQRELTLTIAARAGATFTAGANGTQVATADGISYTVRGSTDLAAFTSPVVFVSKTAAADPAYELHTFRLVSSEGLASGKGFLQATATHP